MFDVVVVAVSYRLSAFGFLSVGNEEAPGNAALFDQLLALKWVQTNIKNFGGDPLKVAIFGESAGSGSVGLHLVSPLSTGTFSKGILQSGSPLSQWAAISQDKATERAYMLAEAVGCDTEEDLSKVIECLKDATAEIITEKQLTLTGNDNAFRPLVDGNFLPETPLEIISSGKFNRVPTIIGLNKDEGTLFIAQYASDFVQGEDINLPW